MEKYFVCFDGEYKYFKAKEDQLAYIEKCIEICAEDGEWNLAVEGIFSGEVTEHVVLKRMADRDECCLNPEYDPEEAEDICPYQDDDSCEWLNKGMPCNCYDPYYEAETRKV